MKLKNITFNSYFNNISVFNTEQCRKINANLLLKQFMAKILNDAIQGGYDNIDPFLERSIYSNPFLKDIESLTDILINKNEEFVVVTSLNYEKVVENVDSYISFTGAEKIIGYIPGENNNIDKKYHLKIDLENTLSLKYLEFLLFLKYQVILNMDANINMANKPILKKYYDNVNAGAVQEELNEKLKAFADSLLGRGNDPLLYLDSRDSLELTMPSLDSQEMLISRINKEISQLTGLSLTYIEGKVVGNLGNNDGDRVQNEKVFSRINKSLILPILNYIQNSILNKTEIITEKSNNLIDFEKTKALAGILMPIEASTVLTSEEKRKIVEKYL